MAHADVPVHVLGGGPAGLAVAFYARMKNVPVQLYEAGPEIGGNGRTIRYGTFRFDMGAHRLHDRVPHVTNTFKHLLGDDLLQVEAPSQIYWRGRFIDFPLSPFDLLKNLPWSMLARVAGEMLSKQLQPATASHFEAFATRTYGPTLAKTFLLDYSEKLWGAPADRLSTRIAGARLKGLDLKTFMLEVFGRKHRKTRHLDGTFYYPRYGYGSLFEAVAREVGDERIHTNARVTRLRHDGQRLQQIEINDSSTIAVDRVVSSLPLTLTLRLLDPPPPAEVLALARTIRFRDVRLAVFLLDRPRLTPNASIYFPEPVFPFTRLYEPKNRSPFMAPPHQTAVVLEIPCAPGDRYRSLNDEALAAELTPLLRSTGLLAGEEVLDVTTHLVPYAYPVLELGFESVVQRLTRHLSGFENLHLIGRSTAFAYVHVHDLFDQARDVVQSFCCCTKIQKDCIPA